MANVQFFNFHFFVYDICMDFYIKGKDLHHAYCIVGNAEKIIFDLQNFLEKDLKFPVHGNPDFWYGEYDVLDIDDSRTLKELHQNKPTAFDKKVFVVSTNFITEKAQNAMLKLFEEPSGKTHFFLIMPSAQNIIPTLKSRMIILEHDFCHPREGGDPENQNRIPVSTGMTESGKTFLKSQIGKRIEIIKNLMDSVSDEEKSKMEVVKLINSIESEIFLRKSTSSLFKSVNLLENIEKIRQYASDGSPSLKMLLEYLAIIL